MQDDVFITYTHPDQQADKSNRRKTAQYIGTYYRNRSRPVSRWAAEERARQKRTTSQTTGEQYQGQTTCWPQNEAANVILHVRPEPIPRDYSGIRVDPFAAYPVRYSDAVAPAIDYYIHFYARAHLLRPEVVSAEHGAHLVQQHFQYAVQHPLMFEAIVTLAQANSSISHWTDQNGDRLTLYHYGQTISKLRKSLSNARERMEDAILFAIMALMGVSYLLNDLTAFQANLMGLRRLVALRGGLDALGWPTLLKPGLQGLEAFWTYISHQPHLVQRQTVTGDTPAPMIDVTPVSSVVNPNLSFKEMLPKLPAGFRILAEQSRLSENLIRVIYQIAESRLSLRHASPTFFVYWDGVRKFTNYKTYSGDEITVASNLQVYEQLARLLANPELTLLERVCCIGTFIGVLCSTRSEQLSPIYLTQLQHHAGELLEIPLDDDGDDAAINLVIWTMFNVASTMVPPRLSTLPMNYQDDLRFALTVKLVDHFSAKRMWEEMQMSLQMFIWNDSCLGAWKSVWDLGTEYSRSRISDT